MKRLTVLAILACLLPCSFVLGNDIKADLDKAYGKALAGDIRPIFSVLDSTEDVDKSEFAELHDKYEKRFVTADERIEFAYPLITRLYGLHTVYWRSSLLDPGSERKARKILVSGLKRLAKSEGYKVTLFESLMGPNIDKLETFLIKTAKERGYYLLMGQTLPLRELMIWKKEEKEICHVELPSDSFSVNVVFLQEFLSKGWLGYATFNRSYSGGWYKGDTIYRVGGKLDDNNEWFRVSLLGHEGRHISDEKLYGILDSRILEYRAKLTELLLAEKTFWKLLNQFRNEAQAPGSSPHSYASYQLTHDLMGELTQGQKTKSLHTFRFEDYSEERLMDAMKLLLDKSSESLETE